VNFEINGNAGIPEDTDTGKVDDIVQKKNVSEFKVYDDLGIETRFVSKREKELLRVAAVQINFKLSPAGFPPEIIGKNEAKAKVMRALEMALNEEVDIVCLPELCVCEDWIPEIKVAYQDVAVIAGSYYDAEKHNVCKPLLGSGADIPPQIKITPSPFEEAGIIGKKMVSGDKLHIYDTKIGKFSVLICRDFINLRHHLRGKTDIIFVPSYNEKIERFHEDANNHITNSPGYIVISNTSLYGGTSIFGIIRKEFNNDLIEAGYKVEGDGLYKLCELKKGEEGLIIADFNLIHKSIQTPAPANPAEEIRPVSYVYKKIIEF
jgi:predicted amidohydrolase